MSVLLADYKEVLMENYGIDLINAKTYWKKGYKGKGVVTAVIDSGCKINHPELMSNIIGFQNFTKDDGGDEKNVTDYIGHGTHVSGIIAGSNKEVVCGVAPDSKILVLKVIDKNGKGEIQNVIRAIEYALTWKGPKGERVEIINMSLGTKNDSSEMKVVVSKAFEQNILIVVAAGNYGDGNGVTQEILYPGFYNEVIQVSAGDQNYEPTYFTNTNVEIDYLAPGEEIFSTYLDNSFAKLSGTSMAAPHVAGASALLVGYYKELGLKMTIKQIKREFDRSVVFNNNYTLSEQGKGHIRLKDLK